MSGPGGVWFLVLAVACGGQPQAEPVCENYFVPPPYDLGPPPVPGGFGFPCQSDSDCPGVLRCAMVGQLGLHAGNADTVLEIDTCQVPCSHFGDCLSYASETPTGGRCAQCYRAGYTHPGSCYFNICTYN